MFPRAVSRSGRSLKPAHFALYYAQRIVTLPALRTVTAKVLASAVNIQHPPAARGSSPETAAVLGALRNNGCSEIPAILSSDQLKTIRKYLDNTEVMLGDRAYRGAPASLPPGATADYPIEALLGCDDLVEIANHPFVLEVAREYLGCAPTISTMAVRWSTPDAKAANITQRFHRDYDDWRFLKLFIYLNDVDLDAGPHTYALGSHRRKARLLARPYSDNEVEKTYGSSAIKRFVGPAGTAFFCDTYGIHKGAVPLAKPRLMFLVQYSILPVYAFDYAAKPAPSTRQIDPYTNRLFMSPLQTKLRGPVSDLR